MCTTEVVELNEAMADAEMIKEAHRSINKETMQDSISCRDSYRLINTGVTPWRYYCLI